MTGHVIRVVSALILDNDNRMLMTHRSARQRRPLLWEHPGGKVNDGESLRHAVVRELHEEIGVTATVHCFVGEAKLEVETWLSLTLWHCTIVGEPSPIEAGKADSIGWFSLDDAICDKPCTPGTYLFYRDIVDFLSAQKQAA